MMKENALSIGQSDRLTLMNRISVMQRMLNAVT